MVLEEETIDGEIDNHIMWTGVPTWEAYDSLLVFFGVVLAIASWIVYSGILDKYPYH